MAIIATGSKTIIDLSDGKSISVYIGSNLPRTQIYDVNASSNQFTPNWASTNLVLTPTVYANNEAISVDNEHLSVEWRRKEGTRADTGLTTGETASGNVLTVTANKLSSITSNLLTYIANVTYQDPDTGLSTTASADITFALVRTGTNGTNGTNAKLVTISGEQTFKYEQATPDTPTPTQIQLTANTQGSVGTITWQYKNSSGNFVSYPTGDGNTSINQSTLYVKPGHAVFNGNVATIKASTTDANVYDVISIYKVKDGTNGTNGNPGVSASTVFLTNESITFAANYQGKVAATTANCNVVAYTGTTKVTPTVGTVTGAPSGMTVTAGSAASNEIPLTITVSANAELGGSAEQNGELVVPVTAPVKTNLIIHWSKVNTGATGNAGQNAIVFSLYAPNGTVFTNQTGTKTIQTQAYDGSTAITSGASYKWYQYSSGSWTVISGQTGSSLSVSGASVTGQASFKCEMTYKSKTYTDIITLIDKTDNYQLEIDSTAGDVFKNAIGTTILIARLWQNGQEVDAPKSTTYSKTNPSSASTNDYYYQIQNTGATTTLMKYSGSAWSAASGSDVHTKTYKWYRRDKDGNAMDDGAAWATGKVIYVTDADVTYKTVFVCEAE